ncbi:MAG: response regulator transcription factor [Anaerolineae bacterium]|jgi:DNA-binding NarL/FixJ family response regulator|nr:response regulator transcription factor [Anaerolineae bacterium]
MMAIRIVIADDADLVIVGAQSVLNADHRFNVVGTARCIDDLLRAVEYSTPDVVVLNEWIHNLDILSVVETLKQVRPTMKIVVMGGLADGLLIRDLFASGVSGYLYRSDDLCELLVTAIETAMLDRPYLSPTANAEYLIAMQSPNANDQLDPESRQVLQLLAHGEHAGQISERLGIDKRRVYWVREKLRRRFGAKTNEHLIQRAAAEGFIYPRD